MSVSNSTSSTHFVSSHLVSFHNEDRCQFVSTVGLSLLSDEPITYSQRNINYPWLHEGLKEVSIGHKVYVKISHLPLLLRLLDTFSNPITIITNGDDNLFPLEVAFDNLLTHPKIVAIFAQNYCAFMGLPSYFYPIPIGIDYHTLNWEVGNHSWGSTGLNALEQEHQLLECRANQDHLFMCDPTTVLTNFHHSMNDPPRRKMLRQPCYDALKDVQWMTWLPNTTRVEFWKSLRDKVFVLCPPGNGFDTHRTWEVLMLGRIPIIQALPINEVYEGLPVWIVNDWKSFAALTKYDLQVKFIEFYNRWSTFDFSKLTLPYWKTYINDKVAHEISQRFMSSKQA